MDLKNLKTKVLVFAFLTLIIPFQVYAYSDYIIAGGENVGIKINSNYVMVVGSYDIGSNQNKTLVPGDKILRINGYKVSSINEMLNVISKTIKNSSVSVDYLRGTEENTTTLKLVLDENGVYKTGLSVKDSISGVGTLTYIDPNTKLYGALGHEIIEKNTSQKLDIKDGQIYQSNVISIVPSRSNSPGEKNANYNQDNVYGTINENTYAGIFGDYTATIPDKKLYKVATINDIKLDKAQILTVVEGDKIESFDINILKLNNGYDSKNILFQITDERLLEKTGGIVQGMSGSPIVQGDYIIGAVTHVVVNEPTKGYGILITNMLEEAEK